MNRRALLSAALSTAGGTVGTTAGGTVGTTAWGAAWRTALGSALGAGTAGCAGAQGSPLSQVTIAGGTDGGVYDALADAFAAEIRSRWQIPAEVVSSNESIDNLRMVAERKAHIGFATVDICDLALQGDHPFTGVLPIAALAGVYEDYLQLIVSADSQITKVSQLPKVRVSLGAIESGTELLATRILHAEGLIVSELPHRFQLAANEAAELMRAGNLDAFFVMGGLPTPTVTELAKKKKIYVVSLADQAKAVRDKNRHIYLLRSLPSGTYGYGAEVPTIGVGNVIVIHKDAPDAVAFRLTELLLAVKPRLVEAHPEALRLGPRTAVSTFNIPLHRGALSYYRKTKPFPGNAAT